MTNVFVPPELLEKLHCSSCNGYLSVFPIHINAEGEKPICGRCKIPNDDYLRDEAYEGLAQFLIFPCLQAKNGCSEQLTPLKLKDHEQCCTNRKIDCPSKSFSRCNWQGPNKSLKSHFDLSHPNLVLKDRKFEIQFINSIKENMLMQFEEEIFIVRKEIDSRHGNFMCSVQHVIQKEHPESFNYFIRFETGDSTYHFNSLQRSTSPDSEEKIKFSANDLRDKLNNPETIVASVEIVKTGFKEEEEVKVNTEVKSPEVDWELLSELECPVCFDFMLPPIYQCVNGHSICALCKLKVAECPVCRGEINSTQNFSLEKLTVRMIYPCKHHKAGCSVALKSSEIRAHESCCEFGPYDCPLAEVENCVNKFTKSEIIDHVENNHDTFVLKSDRVNIPISDLQEETSKYFYLIKFANRIFKVCFKNENHNFYWALQLIGPAEECKKFKFEIDIIDNSHKKLRQYARSLCVPFTKQEECFTKKGNYVIYLHEQISDFITETLSFRVRVVKE